MDKRVRIERTTEGDPKIMPTAFTESSRWNATTVFRVALLAGAVLLLAIV